VKIGDLVYCKIFDEYGTIVDFNHRAVGPDVDDEDILDVLWPTGEVTAVGETNLEVINASR